MPSVYGQWNANRLVRRVAVTDAVAGSVPDSSRSRKSLQAAVPTVLVSPDGRFPSTLAGRCTILSGDERDGDPRSTAESHSRPRSVGCTTLGRWVASSRSVPDGRSILQSPHLEAPHRGAGFKSTIRVSLNGCERASLESGWAVISRLGRAQNTHSCLGLAVEGRESHRVTVVCSAGMQPSMQRPLWLRPPYHALARGCTSLYSRQCRW